MAPADACKHGMFVEVAWRQRMFAVPLAQLQPINVDENTTEAIADWRYWVDRGYEF